VAVEPFKVYNLLEYRLLDSQNSVFTFSVKEMYDYQGRSYLHVPQDVGVNLRSTVPPEKCYLPKKQIHVWSGHTKVGSRVCERAL